ncbi:hypothetical protein [Rufibacter immobilis]|uniref:hypothetical protein n=1 Tax=Rufibacter immobilis TaxID=1348778 RepID=UPI0035ED7C51
MAFSVRMFLSAVLIFVLKATASVGQINKKELSIGVGVTSGNGYPVYILPESDGGIYNAILYAEYGLSKLFSVGPYLLYSREVATYVDPYYPALNSKDVNSGFDAGMRGSFHTSSFLFTKLNGDLYFTGFYGYTYRSVVYDKKNIYRDDFNTKIHDTYFGGLVGLSYNFLPKIGLYGEVGFSKKLFLGAGVRFLIKKSENQSNP